MRQPSYSELLIAKDMYTSGGISAPESVFSRFGLSKVYTTSMKGSKLSILHRNQNISLRTKPNCIVNPLPWRVLITIDGLSGAGKTTVGIKLAKSLRIAHMESGYIFKAVAKALLDDPEAHCINNASLVKQRLAQVTVSDIADPTLDQWNYAGLVPVISGIKEVQGSFYNAVQRLSRQIGSLVITGRSIGNNITPVSNPVMNFFLKVSPATAAYRKAIQMEGIEMPSSIELSTLRRNKQDINHNIVSIPRGAIVIDTDTMTSDEVMLSIEAAIRKKLLSRFN